MREDRRRRFYDDPRDNYWNNPTRPEGWPWWGASSFQYTNAQGRLSASAYKSNGIWQSAFYAYDQQGRVVKQHTQSQGQANPWERLSLTYN